jgi:hypothetical protein
MLERPSPDWIVELVDEGARRERELRERAAGSSSQQG